jgi:hypothetical protein
MFYKLEPRPKNANCPNCKSAETFISLYKESRYCNNCDRTFNQSEKIHLEENKEEEKINKRMNSY